MARPGNEPFVKRFQGCFVGYSIADQHRNEIDQVVGAEAGAGETRLSLDRIEDSLYE
uniref:Uncharacterized protein n=1 Tax=Thermosporothrix sp. COM3 TaxID=2490863 RepID=A0A455SG18_9CHLR|nr:hypothetical protein KTC_11910 [Thermosporothrix sp. COM3]